MTNRFSLACTATFAALLYFVTICPPSQAADEIYGGHFEIFPENFRALLDQFGKVTPDPDILNSADSDMVKNFRVYGIQLGGLTPGIMRQGVAGTKYWDQYEGTWVIKKLPTNSLNPNTNCESVPPAQNAANSSPVKPYVCDFLVPSFGGYAIKPGANGQSAAVEKVITTDDRAALLPAQAKSRKLAGETRAQSEKDRLSAGRYTPQEQMTTDMFKRLYEVILPFTRAENAFLHPKLKLTYLVDAREMNGRPFVALKYVYRLKSMDNVCFGYDKAKISPYDLQQVEESCRKNNQELDRDLRKIHQYLPAFNAEPVAIVPMAALAEAGFEYNSKRMTVTDRKNPAYGDLDRSIIEAAGNVALKLALEKYNKAEAAAEKVSSQRIEKIQQINLQRPPFSASGAAEGYRLKDLCLDGSKGDCPLFRVNVP